MAENEPIPNGSESLPAAVEAVEILEETPVIDVHVPHGGLHTWKDFWIHLGTITLGLLIAISLEQTVEWVHQLHERHQLEEDLRAEGLRNQVVLAGDLRTYAVERVWLLGLRDEVDRMRASGGKLKLAYPAKPVVDPDTKLRLGLTVLPSDAVWSTAKESALVALLPRQEAEVYARFSWQHELLTNALNAWIEEGIELKAYGNRFDDAGLSSTPDLSRMTASQLDEYSSLLARDIALRDNLVHRLTLFDAENRAILDGARTEEYLLRNANR
jgi:hypothetical protein